MLKSANPFTGQQIDNYKILSLISNSETSEVWLGECTLIQRRIVVKLLPRRLAANIVRVRRFELEARVTATLNHPNIISILDFGRDSNNLYMAVEYIEGKTLQQLLRNGQLKLVEAVNIIRQVASALAATHSACIVHRNLRPENIMVRKDGKVKVLDYGLAKLLRPNAPANPPSAFVAKIHPYLTEAGISSDSVSHLSPEQICGLEVDTRNDLFCLGAVFYELLSGVRPFSGANATEVMEAILSCDPTPLAQYRQEDTLHLEQILSRALQKDREARYQTANEFLQDLDDFKLELEK